MWLPLWLDKKDQLHAQKCSSKIENLRDKAGNTKEEWMGGREEGGVCVGRGGGGLGSKEEEMNGSGINP